MVLRFLRFNVVGALGVVVQLSAVAILVGGLGVHYLVATAIAIEMAVLHNFFWHLRWTWAAQSEPGPGNAPRAQRHVFFRCVAFHAGNGLVSMLGSMALMPMLVDWIHLHYLLANLAAICVTGLMNFFLGDRVIFRA
jgi:putative flippase GtrA